jgi:hypothetical protein
MARKVTKPKIVRAPDLADLLDSESFAEAQSHLAVIVSAFGHAESCETAADFLANLTDALGELDALRDAINECLTEAG